MQATTTASSLISSNPTGVLIRSPTPPLDSSSEDLDELCIDQELIAFDCIGDAPKKPHFLDYDAIPPPGFEDTSIRPATGSVIHNNSVRQVTMSGASNYPGENVKLDKKYERDGEISDYELAASDVMKVHRMEKIGDVVELLQDPHTSDGSEKGARKKKHFLDENPIAPDYEVFKREREHRSLDRNFERMNEGNCSKYERKLSLDRGDRPRRQREPSYTLARFMARDTSPVCRGTWPTDRPTDSITTGHYSSMPIGEISQLGPKVECVYSLLSMLGSHDALTMSTKFLDMSRTPETCAALRRSGCIPLLVQIIHSDAEEEAKHKATIALHNVVHCHPDDKAGRREAKVLKFVEQVMDYCEVLRSFLNDGESIADDSERHPSQTICSLMKISFDEEHRHAMCQLGALQAIANLVHLDHAAHGSNPDDSNCITLRRYAGMALTNLTFGDGNNKALLCGNKEFIKALVTQLESPADELLQVTASVLRNLSWRADPNMKTVLNEIGTVTALIRAAMKNKNENTLKAILSALWNLTVYSPNRVELCAAEGSLQFLVDMLSFEVPSKKTLIIVENAGGVLNNVSSHIAVREDYRKILRQQDCLGILLHQLKSESLTVVSNACGTLWNLSARCQEDQKYLWDNGAVPMLRSLIHSKHKLISNGSSAALKNLLNFRPGGVNQNNLDPIAKSMGLKELPTLNVRKQRALQQELDQNFSETCETVEVTTPPKETKNLQVFMTMEQQFRPQQSRNVMSYLTRSVVVSKSESRDSIVSAKSDSVYEKLVRPNGNYPTVRSSSLTIQEQAMNSASCSGSVVMTCAANSSNAMTSPSSLLNPKLMPADDEEATVNFATIKTEKYEDDTDLPINYGAKYSCNETENKMSTTTTGKDEPTNFSSSYQETDLDQLTDYSLRYAENQAESDMEEPKPVSTSGSNYGNEIILILEDSVKLYQTEGTPYTISNAASITDLRNARGLADKEQHKETSKSTERTTETFNSGIQTPEKPTKYCDEGTPGYFSRYESLSSLDNSPPGASNVSVKASTAVEVLLEEDKSSEIDNDDVQNDIISAMANSGAGSGSTSKAVTFDFAQETPLMFSRHSSVESLSSAEPVMVDDMISCGSDISRLASGIISPSDLPDSPMQSVPQSPRRIATGTTSASTSFPNTPPAPHYRSAQPRLRSVFEDDFNTFDVENTPAQFSCRTSLSNLSIDDEPKIATDCLTKEDKSDETANGLMHHVQATKLCSTTASDGEESGNDDILFATCINLGMNRPPRATTNIIPRHSGPLEYNEDSVKQYYTEGTPASKAESNSDLSVLSLEANQMDILSDISSNGSDMGNDNLLEQCIRDGMPKASTSRAPQPQQRMQLPTQIVRDNPINMLRSGGLPPYLPVNDEYNKFNVEDSPCNFSVRSGLSDITCGSSVARVLTNKRLPISDTMNQPYQEMINNVADDSLSSISIDSEDDGNLLSQAIAAGFNAKPKNALPSKIQPMSTQKMLLPPVADPNDSQSSIDSCESNENHASLLELCIRSGMMKAKNTKTPLKVNKPIHNQLQQPVINKPATSLSPKRSQLPMYKSAPSNYDRQRDRERKDEQLLMECISAGMPKTSVESTQQIKPPVRHVRQVLSTNDFNQRMANLQISESEGSVHQQHQIVGGSKNGQTTSVAVSETFGATNMTIDVEKVYRAGTNESKRDHPLQLVGIRQTIGSSIEKPVAAERRTLHGSLNLSTGANLLDRSNEYPADINDMTPQSNDDQSHLMGMIASNEFLVSEESSVSKIDKHKDPDQMLRSVERLTHELVSTAEYLRTTASNSDKVGKEGSNNSNNTWNEDTCPNDVSFPSLSMTAPMISSMNDDDATISEQKCDEIVDEATPVNENKSFIDGIDGNEAKYFTSGDVQFNLQTLDELESMPNFINGISSQPDSLETETDTLVEFNHDVNNEIMFRVGGEVQTIVKDNFASYPSLGTLSMDTSSTMTTSTIIAMEARKIASELQNMQKMTDSTASLDLDNIRPPSGMDSLSMSGYFDLPHSPQVSQKNRKKSLPMGLMAKRALANNHRSGSSESMTSVFNLDNIKPPSIMDDLLDSMISVASITSEIADGGTYILDATSQYETALSDIDDTPTLRSCCDLPSDATPIQSDFSSAESTPRKVRHLRRTLTPKQKRQVAKDRYRTYTIAADMVLKEKIDELRREMSTREELNGATDTDDEVMSIEIQNGEEFEITTNCVKKLTPRQRRQEERSRFQTQVVDSAMLEKAAALDTSDMRRRSHNPERYRTRTISSQDLEGVTDGTFIKNGTNSKDIVSVNTDTMLNEAGSVGCLNDDEDLSLKVFTEKFNFVRDFQVPTSKSNAISTSILTRISHIKQQSETQTHRTQFQNSDSEFISIEFEQNSETESCDQNFSSIECQVDPVARPRPKIVKPMTQDESVEEETVSTTPESKGIRGRKKASYVSPYKKNFIANNKPTTVTKQISPPVGPNRVNLATKTVGEMKKTAVSRYIPSNSTVIAKTHVIINKANLTNKINTIRSGIAKPGFTTPHPKKNMEHEKNLINKTMNTNIAKQGIPKKASLPSKTTQNVTPTCNGSSELTPTMPARQGTFVKEEPTCADVPIVETLSPNKSKLPSKIPSPKTSTQSSPAKSSSGLMSKLKLPQARKDANKSPTVTSINKTSLPKSSIASKSLTSVVPIKRTTNQKSSPPTNPAAPFRSHSNASLRNISKNKEPSLTQPPSRSNSNLAPPKTNIASKIAGLWKRTDAKKVTPSSVQNGKASSAIPAGKQLIRSSTFDSTPEKKETAIVDSKIKSEVGSKQEQQQHPSSTTMEVGGIVRRDKRVDTNVENGKRISRLGSFIIADE